MPWPITLRSSSRRTALVVVEPRSMPTKVFMHSSSSRCVHAGTLLIDHLEVALETILDVGRRKIARIDQVRFHERRRFSGALLALAHHQQLPGGEAVASLDRVDQKAVRFVFVDVVDQHIHARRQSAVGVDAEAVFSQSLKWYVRIMPDSDIID